MKCIHYYHDIYRIYIIKSLIVFSNEIFHRWCRTTSSRPNSLGSIWEKRFSITQPVGVEEEEEEEGEPQRGFSADTSRMKL